MLNKFKFSDSWFWCKYSINPYRGCAHACIYCDGRSERYYTQENFEEDVISKTDLPDKLLRYLKSAKNLLPDVVATGGICDVYQPLEKTNELMKKILKIFRDTNFPVCLSTKSDLILRDTDLLQEIAERTWCATAVSISTADDNWAKILEPNAASVDQRFEVIKEIKEKSPKVLTGINFMPIIPFISDSDENIEAVIKRASEAHVDYILFAVGVTLRDRQGEFFYNKMKAHPEISAKIRSFMKTPWEQLKPYFISKNTKIKNLCDKYGIKIRIPRYIPNDWRKYNYIIAKKLFYQSYLKSLEGKKNFIENSIGHYINTLPESIESLQNTNQLDQIPNITDEIKKIIVQTLPKASGLGRFLT